MVRAFAVTINHLNEKAITCNASSANHNLKSVRGFNIYVNENDNENKKQRNTKNAHDRKQN